MTHPEPARRAEAAAAHPRRDAGHQPDEAESHPQRHRGPPAGLGLPEVLFIDDVAALLRCSPSTIKRRLRARVFPVAPLPGIDKRPRWSKARCSSGSRPVARAGRCGGAGGGRGERGRGTRRPGDEEAGCRGVVHGRVRGGRPVFICAGCWPAVAAYWWEWPDATVRVVGQRPEWARCGVCNPERVSRCGQSRRGRRGLTERDQLRRPTPQRVTPVSTMVYGGCQLLAPTSCSGRRTFPRYRRCS